MLIMMRCYASSEPVYILRAPGKQEVDGVMKGDLQITQTGQWPLAPFDGLLVHIRNPSRRATILVVLGSITGELIITGRRSCDDLVL